MLELVVMVGLQGSGKSSWVREHLAATHVVISKDHWPNARGREMRQRTRVAELLGTGRSVVVDNTNPSPAERAPLLEIGRAHGALLRAVYLAVPLAECLARNEHRQGRHRVPMVGVLATSKRLTPPSHAEGFDLVEVMEG